MKATQDYDDLYLKCDVLLSANVFDKFRINSLKIIDHVQFIIWAHKVQVGMQCLKWQKLSSFQILTFIHSLSKVQEVEFLRDTVNPTINIQNMILWSKRIIETYYILRRE